MRLRRIEIENWRRFGEPRVFEPAPGATVISGPNESGKSTLFEAVRAGLFDMCQSQGPWIDEISPWDSAGATPTVALEFETEDGQRRRIRKELGRRGRALLERLEGDGWRAEERNKAACHRVVELLGGSAPTKGRSVPRDWGALRWLFMPDVERSLPSADDAAVEELGPGVACVSPDFDRVVERARRECSRWYAPKGRETKNSDLATARRELASARREADGLRDDVARHDAERERHRELAAQRPELEERLAALKRAVETLTEERAALDTERERVDTLTAREKSTGERADELRRRIEERERLQREVATADEAMEAARKVAAEANVRGDDVRHALAAAERTLADAEAAATTAREAHELARLERRLRRARELDRAVETSLAAVVAGPDDEALAAARALEREHERKSALAEAGSLTVDVDRVGDARVLADGVQIEASGKALRVVRIELPGGGAVTVRSPVDDAAEAAREADEARVKLAAVLERWGAASLAELEICARGARTTGAAAAAARRERAAFTDAATADLAVDLDAARSRSTLGEVRAEDGEELRRLADVEIATREALETARAAAAPLRAAAEETSQKQAAARAEEKSAESTLRERRAALEKSREAGALDELRRRRGAAEEERIALERARSELERGLAPRLEDITARLDAARNDLAATERSERALAGEIAALEGSLTAAETAGVWSALGAAESEVARLERRVGRLEVRAEAARLARETLERARTESSRAILEPIAERVRQYVDEVTGGRRRHVALDEDLLPTRLGEHDFAQGSEGLHEVVNMLVRVCVAIDLARSGPQCLVLDDPCARVSDDRMPRLARLLRRVLDENENLQLILLTNRPDAFAGLDAARITLDPPAGRRRTTLPPSRSRETGIELSREGELT